MPFIGGSEAEFTETLQRVDDELAANQEQLYIHGTIECIICFPIDDLKMEYI